MYSTKTAVFSSDNNYLQAGINENVTLKEVNVKTTPNGINYLEIIFQKDGNIAPMTEWENKKSAWIKTDEDLQYRDNLQFGRILQVINAICDEPVGDVELNDFNSMINWVKDTLSPKINAQKSLRLKVVYDKNGFIKVSSNGCFIEPMDVKQEDSKIIITGRDTISKPEIKVDKEEIVNLPKVDTTEESNGDEDLPF